MKVISVPPRLVAQVHDAVVSEIAQGVLPPGSRIVQEQLAERLGVSRQPVQQALLLLRNEGVLADAPGRGLIVAPLDLAHVRNLSEIRAVIEGLAFRRAAQHGAERARRLAPSLMRGCRDAVESGSISEMIAADRRFHGFVHELAGNPLIAAVMEAQWTCAQRVMGEALLRDGASQDIWAQHEAMLQAVMDGDGDRADELARRHIAESAAVVITRLRQEWQRTPDEPASNDAGSGPISGFCFGTPNSALHGARRSN